MPSVFCPWLPDLNDFSNLKYKISCTYPIAYCQFCFWIYFGPQDRFQAILVFLCFSICLICKIWFNPKHVHFLYVHFFNFVCIHEFQVGLPDHVSVQSLAGHTCLNLRSCRQRGKKDIIISIILEWEVCINRLSIENRNNIWAMVPPLHNQSRVPPCHVVPLPLASIAACWVKF